VRSVRRSATTCAARRRPSLHRSPQAAHHSDGRTLSNRVQHLADTGRACTREACEECARLTCPLVRPPDLPAGNLHKRHEAASLPEPYHPEMQGAALKAGVCSCHACGQTEAWPDSGSACGRACLVRMLTVCQTASSCRRTMSSKLRKRPCSSVMPLVSTCAAQGTRLTPTSSPVQQIPCGVLVPQLAPPQEPDAARACSARTSYPFLQPQSPSACTLRPQMQCGHMSAKLRPFCASRRH